MAEAPKKRPLDVAAEEIREEEKIGVDKTKRLKTITKEKTKFEKYAYVTLLMRGPTDEQYKKREFNYLPGALVTAQSIRKYQLQEKEDHPQIVCMVTPDVGPLARALLAKLYDQVVQIDYLEIEGQLKTAAIEQIYKSWKSQSATKWRCLSLICFEKVLLVDLDKIMLKNIDELFNLEAPAGSFAVPQAEPYVLDKGTRNPSKHGIHNPYISVDGFLKQHGETIWSAAIDMGLHDNSFVAIGTCILLKPDLELLEEYKTLISDLQWNKGLNCYSMLDEQSLCLLYLLKRPKTTWTFIDTPYNFVAGKTPAYGYQWLAPSQTPFVIHYVGKQDEKPWHVDRKKWPDLGEWWQVAESLCRCVLEPEVYDHLFQK
jgi:hypothetical protein